jgi:hypothetical protein
MKLYVDMATPVMRRVQAEAKLQQRMKTHLARQAAVDDTCNCPACQLRRQLEAAVSTRISASLR